MWRGSQAEKELDEDMACSLHEHMTPEELRESKIEIYGPFSKKRFAKRIDQKREASKPYGKNPMQAASKKEMKEKKKIKNRPEISRRMVTGGVSAYVNQD